MGQSRTHAASAVDTVLVTAGGPKTLHLPREGEPRCGTQGQFVEKPLAVFPPEHREWCAYCEQMLDNIDGVSDPNRAEPEGQPAGAK